MTGRERAGGKRASDKWGGKTKEHRGTCLLDQLYEVYGEIGRGRRKERGMRIARSPLSALRDGLSHTRLLLCSAASFDGWNSSGLAIVAGVVGPGRDKTHAKRASWIQFPFRFSDGFNNDLLEPLLANDVCIRLV